MIQSDHSSTSLVQALLDNLYSSPTPYHAVERVQAKLVDAGCQAVPFAEPWPTEPGAYVTSRHGALISWILPERWNGFNVVGAHTDSPNLRLRKRPDLVSARTAQLAVEIYGGALLNSWFDRDLALAGQVAAVQSDGTIIHKLVKEQRPIMRVPRLAIHLDRSIRKDGFKPDAQKHMSPVWSIDPTVKFIDYLGELCQLEPSQIVAWDLMAYDTQRPSFAGLHDELVASARIDNLFSCFAGAEAMATLTRNPDFATEVPRLPVLVLFDHEEVGSVSKSGANSSFLTSVLERIALAAGKDRADYLAEVASSLVLSVDGAHATHPNYQQKHDPNHSIYLNAGVVVKRNANQRYATAADGEALLGVIAEQAGVPLQYYSHRNDIPCGSTIGPATAAQLGATTVDLGAPQWAMHSCRETAGSDDFVYLCRLIEQSWRSAP